MASQRPKSEANLCPFLRRVTTTTLTANEAASCPSWSVAPLSWPSKPFLLGRSKLDVNSSVLYTLRVTGIVSHSLGLSTSSFTSCSSGLLIYLFNPSFAALPRRPLLSSICFSWPAQPLCSRLETYSEFSMFRVFNVASAKLFSRRFPEPLTFMQ